MRAGHVIRQVALEQDVYDVLTIAAIVDELHRTQIDGRIQQVAQVDELTIALEVYASRQRRWLILSAHPERARVLLSTRRVDGDAERITPLLLLLRKYARGGRIVSVSQPRYERIIQVSIAKPIRPNNVEETDDDDPDVGEDLELTTIFIELMGRRSNIILTDNNGRILEAIKRVTPSMSRVRPIRPGAAYVPPPAQHKQDPLRVTTPSLLEMSLNAVEPASKWLVNQFLGVSPAIAMEVAARAGIAPETHANAFGPHQAQQIVHALTSIFSPLDSGEWQPITYQVIDGRTDFFATPMQSIEHGEGVTAVAHPSIFAAAEAAWEASLVAAAQAPGRHAIRRDRLVAEIDEARERVRQRVHSLDEQMTRSQEAEALRTAGELIYVWISEIRQRQSTYTTPDGVEIALDPTLTPSQNAQEYFERYRKARSAEENLPALLEEAARELAYLDELRSMATLAETYDEIELVRIEWLAWAETARGGTRVTRPKGARPAKQARRPRVYRTMHGDAVYLGRTGQQNDEVTFSIANPDDLWLHVRNMPGAHVVVRAHPRLSDDTIERAASLAAWYSDGRQSTTVPVDVTERRHVRKIRGAGPGMVTYRNERTLNVHPRSETDLGLESRDE